ncbi:hypothetical protein [Halobacillus sp. B29]|uniref:hypothetical protein n=1 Tax=Halobacillus sp. B29 TaxID=3457432 RepID=UPI003FCEA98D
MNPDICSLFSNDSVLVCYLTDELGETVESITCRESGSREDVTVTLSGESVVLQRVSLINQGFVVVEISNDETTCITDPIPFCFVETLLLCAPDGTDIECKVTEFDCQACVNCQNGEFQSLDIFFDVCLSVQTVVDTVFELPISFCVPRKEIEQPPCTFKIPDQCSTIFSEDTTEGKQAQPKVNSEILNLPAPQPTPSQQQEVACVSATKVYDWVVSQNSFRITRNQADITFQCFPCEVDLFVPADIFCTNVISGRVVCATIPIEGAEVTLSASPDLVLYDMNPVTTDENGYFDVNVEIPEDTEATDVTIMAEAIVRSVVASASTETVVECPEDPCGIDLFAPATITCDDFMDGRVRCNGRLIEGALVTFDSNAPGIVTFEPPQIETDSLGDYFTGVRITNGTAPQTVTLIASTTVEGQMVSDSVDVTVNCPLDACILTINVPQLIDCMAVITGNISCNGMGIEGAEIFFSDFPEDVVTYEPNPAISDINGDFTTTIMVPEGTSLTDIDVEATTTVQGQMVEANFGTQIICLPEECPCKFRIRPRGSRTRATVELTQNGMVTFLDGIINLSAIQCFRIVPGCNPDVDDFSVVFRTDQEVIRFVQGRRLDIECESNTFARVHGTATAEGNVLNGLFDVTIELSITAPDIGVWTVSATDNMGNTFFTSFVQRVSRSTFIGDCDDAPN